MGKLPSRVHQAIALSLSLLGLSACDRTDPHSTGGVAPTGTTSPPSVQAPVEDASAVADEAAPPPPSETPETTGDSPPKEDSEEEPGALSKRWKLGELFDVGPAAPMTATAEGVVLVSKDNRVHLAARKGETFAPVDEGRAGFSRYGRGPAVTERFVYWVSPSGVLMQGTTQGSTPRELDRDVRFGARVSALTSLGRDLVAYVKGKDDETFAWLWAAGAPGGKDEKERLSPEGSTATSVTLVDDRPHPRAVVLEGRSSMSPVHTRIIRVTKKRITLELDQVVWIGPGSHALTELVGLDRRDGGATALLASSRDITHFGLAQIPITARGGEVDDPIWRPYPNGLDPAPVAAASLCGERHALFAIPRTEKPRSPQELRIARLSAVGLEEEEVLAHSRAFNDISIAALPRGAVLSWTADRRTWAMVLGCPDPKLQVAPGQPK